MTVDITTIGIEMETSGLVKGTAALKEAERAAHKTADAADKLTKSASATSERMSALATSARLLAGGVAALAATQTLLQVVRVQREFDVLNSSLRTVTGSSAAAAKEMAWIKDFAKETPFGLAQATQGFVKMKALGLDPTKAALTSFGNTASAMGKDLNQMIEAVADASTGEFERLKEFGITASKQGDQVKLTFQGVTTTIGNNAKEITGYLEGLGKNEFAGAMALRAQTLDGVIGALGDTWDDLYRTVSAAGVGSLIQSSVMTANAVIEDAITLINAMTGAMDANNQKSGVMKSVQEGIAIVFETVAVLAANVKYVLSGIGNELGGLAAQAWQILQGNFAGAAAIRSAMVSDAARARAEIDATTARILSARKDATAAAEVNAQANARLARQGVVDANSVVAAHTKAAASIKKLSDAQKEANRILLANAAEHTKVVDDAIEADEKARLGVEKQIYTARTMAEQIEFETRLLGMNAEQRAIVSAERELERQGIVAGTLAYDAYIQRIKSASAAKANTEAGIKAAKDAADEWKKASEKIEQDITDALMRGFENGKGFADNLKDTLENMFKTMVLRPVIQGVVQGGMSAVGLGSSGGAGNLLGSAGNVASIYNAAGATGSAASLLGSSSMGALDIGGVAIGEGVASGIATALPWIGGALLIGSLLKNDKISSRGTGEGTIGYDATGTQLASESRYTGEWGLTPAVKKSVDGLAVSYINTAKSLGIEAIETQWAFGGNTGKQSADPQFAIGVNAGGASYSSGEMQLNDANIALATSRALLTALQASELPEYLSGAFDGMVASTASQEQINATLQNAQALTNFNRALELLPDHFQQVADLSYEATQSLIGFSGGLENLQSNLGTYYTNFYSAEEQRAQTIANINAATAGSGLDAATATREQFRSIVEAQELTTESGRATYAALLSVAGAFAGLTDAAADLSKAADSAFDALEKAVDDQRRIYQVQVDAAQDAVDEITSVYDVLKSAVAELYGSTASAVSGGNSFIDNALANAQTTGYLPDSTQLADAITAARSGVDSAIYASQADADFARLELAGRLDQLKTISGDQLTGADKALKVAQDQLDALDTLLSTAQAQLDAFNGLSSMVLSIGEAMGAFEKAISGGAASGSAAGAVTVGGATAAASTAGQYADRINTYSGPIATWIDDAERVARLAEIEKYINATFDGSAESIRAIADTAKQYGVSQKDIAAASGYVQTDIEKLFAGVGVPAFLQGTNYTSEGLAYLHDGEAVVPKAYNPAAGGVGNTARLEALIEALTAKVAALEAPANRTANAIEGNQSRPILVELAA